MVELLKGVGGFGGTTTMNTDQREGWYGQHAVVSTTDYMQDITFCHCIKCELRWTHSRGDRSAPTKMCRSGG
jgi:hypothetical protein